MPGKKYRGFTLIELLIVSAMVVTFSSVMSVSMVGSMSRAKVTSIISNVEACTNAAAACVANEDQKIIDGMTADDMLRKYMVKWADFKDTAGDTIVYKTIDDKKGADNWTLVVDFDGDSDKEAIKEGLKRIKGFGKYFDDEGKSQEIMSKGKYSFKVMLNTGKILPYEDETKKEASNTGEEQNTTNP